MLSNARNRLLRTLAPTAVVVAVLCAPSPAGSQTCSFDHDRFPASPPPSSLWSGIKPTYTVLPSSQTGGPSRDTSWYQTNGNFGLHNPFWESIDIEQGYLFAAINLGYQVWDIGADGGNPILPTRLVNRSIFTLAPVLQANPHDFYIPHDIDAAPGDHTLVAMTGEASMGMLLVDARSKANPRAYYQDHGPGGNPKNGEEVYLASIGGRYYGFLAAIGGINGSSGTNGLWVYDLTQARQLGDTTACVEQLPTVQNCPGVSKGRLTTNRTQFVHGTADGSRHFVVFAGGSFSHKGFEIWDVTNPSAPVRKLTGLSADVVHGVALWRDSQSNKLVLALANRKSGVGAGARGQIYDVTCVRTSCGSPGSPVYDFPLTGHAASDLYSSVTFSRTGGVTGTPYVYFGRAKNPNSTVLQSEWLLDVTDPGQPGEVTGGDPLNGGVGQPTIELEGMTLGYFGYYSHCAADGTNWYKAQNGQVAGEYFYRAGFSILDIHELVPVDPRITVSGPATGYTGQTLTYTATGSGGCSPAAGQWTWILGGTGGQVIGPQTGPTVNVQWSSGGGKTISAENDACPGADPVPLSVQIDPAQPNIGTVTAAPTTAPVCTQITFNATATGQPPLSHNWTIEQGGDPVPGEGGAGNPFVWDTEGISPGTYQGRVTVSGPGGSDNATSPNVTLTALPTLPGNGQFTITYDDPPELGEVQFHSSVAGATQWRWNFDDGTILETQDPALGKDPVHVYSEVGNYDVTLQVRNCVETNYRTSVPLEVTIIEVQVLEIIDFQAVCPFGLCGFVTGVPIGFAHNVSGEPSTYMYDWAGDGDFEQSSPTPVTSHNYTQPGTYTPVLKVSLGSQSDTFTAPQITVTQGGPAPTPSITISGPGSLLVGQEGTFTANPQNCSPSPNGWTWTTSGGNGSSTSNPINLSWSSSGNKTITAKNSACGSATGTRVVNVTSPGGGNPSDLEAAFTFSPANPAAGQQVSFDASASTGDIIDWSWSFGDGDLGDGENTSHVYAQPGTYSVTLAVAELGSGQGCQQGVCFDSITKTVIVGGGTGGGGDCAPDDETLCLMDGRFQIRSRFINPNNPQNGIQDAQVYEDFSADRTGMFWFFSPDNVELITKSLDGTNPDIFPNPAYWFFYGGLSNVEYWITVTDTAVSPPETVEYHNLPGVICGLADTAAFPTEDLPLPVQGGAAAPEITGGGIFENAGPGVIAAGGASGTCVPAPGRLCLLEGRYAVEVDWHDHRSGDTGTGQAIPGTDRTGYFWFFRDDNIELVTKMLAPPPPIAHVWVFWGALSDVEYTIKVTDTVTQQEREYHNAPGSFCGGADTTAFDAD